MAQKRTRMDLLNDFLQFLKDRNFSTFYQQELMEGLGISSQTAKDFLELYIKIQSSPKIHKVNVEKNFIFQVLEE
ncbi:MAG: hypothetical protein ACFFCI_02270 [Promethearchaeota archaeon]